MLLIWPVADLPYGDDCAYTLMALKLAQTGQLRYDGWESAILVLQAYWGALIIKVFGFSFNVLRISMLPYAFGSVVLCYLLARRCGLDAARARLVTLGFGLCPIFLPLAASFMTDVPGVFFAFASLYSFARAAEEHRLSWSWFGWLTLGTVLGLAGGTARQVVWFVPITALPYLAWAKRSEIKLAAMAGATWLMVAATVVATMAWFGRQPYAIYQPSLLAELRLAGSHPLGVVNTTARLMLMLVLMSVPMAFQVAAQAARDAWHGTVVLKGACALLLVGLVAALATHPHLASIPWIGGTLNWEGIGGDSPLPGRPVVLTHPIRAAVATTIYVIGALLLVRFLRSGALLWSAVHRFLNPRREDFALCLMTLFSAVYFGLVVIRSSDFDIFDRYLLPVAPCVATLLLLWLERKDPGGTLRRRTIPIAWLLLAVLAAYGIASTQDLWALARARVAAAKRLEAAGIPRTSIDAGFEYNGWTQLIVAGRLNSRWVKSPADAYRADQSLTPALKALYRLEYAPKDGCKAREFGPIPYFTFLPPFGKQVGVNHLAVANSASGRR
jgi:hypothetical protein